MVFLAIMMQRDAIKLFKRIHQLDSRSRQARIQQHAWHGPDAQKATSALRSPISNFHAGALLDVSEIDRVDGAAGVGDHGRFHVAQERPLGGAEEGVGFYVRGACARAEASHFVFYEEFADEGFA